MASSAEAETSGNNDTLASDDTTNENTELASSIPQEFDATFGTKTWKEDVTLVVQGRKLHVSSVVLSLVSPVFASLFDSRFKDDVAKELELEEHTYEHMVEFLLCMYPNVQKNIDHKNVLNVLPLAVKYKTELLKERCTTFLKSRIDSETGLESLISYFKAAWILDSSDIKERCMNVLANYDFEAFKRAEYKNPLPLDAKMELQCKLIESKEKTICHLKNTCCCYSYETYLEKTDQDKLQKHATMTISKFTKGQVGYLQYSVSNISMVQTVTSPATIIHDIEWCIVISKSILLYGTNSMNFYLKANKHQKDVSWSCKVFATFSLSNFDIEAESLFKTATLTFTDTSNRASLHCSELDNITKRFVPGNVLQVDVKFIADKPIIQLKR